jgi:hypothetical protein
VLVERLGARLLPEERRVRRGLSPRSQGQVRVLLPVAELARLKA